MKNTNKKFSPVSKKAMFIFDKKSMEISNKTIFPAVMGISRKIINSSMCFSFLASSYISEACGTENMITKKPESIESK